MRVGWTENSDHRRCLGHRPGDRHAVRRRGRIGRGARRSADAANEVAAAHRRQGVRGGRGRAGLGQRGGRAGGGRDGRPGWRGQRGGIFSSEGLTDTSPELFNRILTVNITGTFLVVQAAERFLRAADSATIVNIGSGVGLKPTGPGSTAYVASKGGVIAMTRALAMELAPKIRVNVVCPGMVETAMTESFLRNNQGEIRPEIAGCMLWAAPLGG